MAFLVLDDLYTSRDDQTEVLVQGNLKKLGRAERDAITEARSYLNARYNLANAFPSVNYWAFDQAFEKDDLIYLTTGKVYSSATAYTVGELVTDETDVYRCIQAGTGQALSDAAYWVKAGVQKEFYVALEDVAAGVYLTDDTKFETGDTRNELLVRMISDLSLYQLCTAINPRNIPEYRIQKRDDAVKWLKDVANPRYNVNADFLPLIDYGDPKKSNNISYGSKPKRRTNKY